MPTPWGWRASGREPGGLSFRSRVMVASDAAARTPGVSRGRVGNRPPASPRRGLGAGRLLVSNHRGQGVIHMLVEDAAATRAALSEAGIEVSGERDVLVVDVEDRPRDDGRVARGSGRPA